MKINGIEIESKGIHKAIIARIANYALENCTIFYTEKEGKSIWEGPKLIPIRIYNIDTIVGVSFQVVLADERDQRCSLSTSEVRELEEQGWLGFENHQYDIMSHCTNSSTGEYCSRIDFLDVNGKYQGYNTLEGVPEIIGRMLKKAKEQYSGPARLDHKADLDEYTYRISFSPLEIEIIYNNPNDNDYKWPPALASEAVALIEDILKDVKRIEEEYMEK